MRLLRSLLPVLLGLLAWGMGTACGAQAANGDRLIDLPQFQQTVHHLLSRPELAGVRVGFKVVELHSGRTLYELNGNGLFNPASNMKVVTTATALYNLGTAYRFQTLFRSPVPLDAQGNLNGDLYVVGGGDPWLVEETLTRIAEDLYRAGLRSVRGDIVVDNTFFDGKRTIPGWKRQARHCYDAPIDALSVNFNTLSVQVLPGSAPGQAARVELMPKTAYFSVRNLVKTTAKGKTSLRLKAKAGRGGGKGELVIQGRINLKSGAVNHTCIQIDNPPQFAGWTFYEYLRLRGIRIGGTVKGGKADEGVKHLLLTAQSPPLGEVINSLNKESNNFMAEQTFKTLGVLKGMPGTWEKGDQVTGEFLTGAIGLKPGGFAIANGSGLGKGNLLSPDLLVKVLRYMYIHPQYASAFVSSLPVMGSDGTLRRRHRNDEACFRIRAKTGYVNKVMSLSGYVDTRGCDKIVFSLLLNDEGRKRPANLRKVQDEMILLLANLALDPGNRGCLAPLRQ